MTTIIINGDADECGIIAGAMARREPGAHAFTFSAADAALDYAAANAVDIAFIHINSTYPEGIATARRLQTLTPRVRIIFISDTAGYTLDAFAIHATGYILEPVTEQRIEAELDYCDRSSNAVTPNHNVRIHTFGNFDVFVDDAILKFTHERSKELLAYLVDRRGASATTAEICAILWEDREYSRSIKNQAQTVISQLTALLRQAGIEDILVKSWNHLALDTSQVDCDYYRLLKNDAQAISRYTGEYMTNYSWAEITASAISQLHGAAERL